MGNSPRIAIAHDYLNQLGGAEKCVEVMHEVFPEAPVFTSIFDSVAMSHAFGEMDIRTSFMQNLPLIGSHFRYYLPLYPSAFESFDFGGYDVVLSSSSAFAKGVVTGPDTCHICYCYTPMRFAWDYDHYIEREHLNGLARAVLPAIVTPLRLWDLASSRGVDYFIAISDAVAQRIRKLYERDSVVIYPPVDTSRYVMAADSVGDYFLVVSRLVPYKRIDIAVEAANRTGLPLKIIGDGRESDRLRAMAKPNVEFLGHISDEEVRHHFAHCKAFIFTGEEDFGLTPVEAQSCGRPVIAYAAGGAFETVVDGVTGVFFREQDPESLAQALMEFDVRRFDPQRIRLHAEKFDILVFKRRLEAFVLKKAEEHQARRQASMRECVAG